MSTYKYLCEKMTRERLILPEMAGTHCCCLYATIAYLLQRAKLPPMRVLLQRVASASVLVGDRVVGGIDRGLLLLVGVTPIDGAEDIDWLSRKIIQLRVFNDDAGLMNRSVVDIGGGLLAVSQFTLFASTRKGNRPSWAGAAAPDVAEPLFDRFVADLELALGKPVPTGQFGADMVVSLVNDGPVTLMIDSRVRE